MIKRENNNKNDIKNRMNDNENRFAISNTYSQINNYYNYLYITSQFNGNINKNKLINDLHNFYYGILKNNYSSYTYDYLKINPSDSNLNKNKLSKDYKLLQNYINNHFNYFPNFQPIRINVSYNHIKYKIKTYQEPLKLIYGVNRNILNDNSINDIDPIVVDKFDDVSFSFNSLNNEALKYSIGIRYYKTGDIENYISNNNFFIDDSIRIDETFTNKVGQHELHIKAFNGYSDISFNYDISVNDIKPYTIKMYKDQSTRHRILLRGNCTDSSGNLNEADGYTSWNTSHRDASDYEKFYKSLIEFKMQINISGDIIDYDQDSYKYYFNNIFNGVNTNNLQDISDDAQFNGYHLTFFKTTENKIYTAITCDDSSTNDVIQFKVSNMETGIFYEFIQFTLINDISFSILNNFKVGTADASGLTGQDFTLLDRYYSRYHIDFRENIDSYHIDFTENIDRVIFVNEN